MSGGEKRLAERIKIYFLIQNRKIISINILWNFFQYIDTKMVEWYTIYI